MYIYLARSIRGDKATDAQFMQRLIDLIHGLGHHTQFDIAVKLLRIGMNEDEYIYKRDLYWINHCHAMIAEVTSPSLGVGYEIAYAKLVCRIPVFCCCEKDSRVSAMINGSQNILHYRGLVDLSGFIQTWLEGISEERIR